MNNFQITSTEIAIVFISFSKYLSDANIRISCSACIPKKIINHVRLLFVERSVVNYISRIISNHVSIKYSYCVKSRKMMITVLYLHFVSIICTIIATAFKVKMIIIKTIKGREEGEEDRERERERERRNKENTMTDSHII